jgi:CRISPR-associated protein Cmr3
MMFRKAGEFDPSSRGIHSRASSFVIPMPSTLVGALASLYAPSYNKAKSWIEEYKVALNNAVFKGPFLKISNVWYFDCSLERLLISQYSLYDYVQNVNKMVNAKSSKEIKELKKEREELIERIRKDNIFKIQERIGIGLKVRNPESDDKIIDDEKGKIYNAEYIEYIDFKNKDIIAEIYLDIINPGNVKVGKYYIKLGGEGKVAELVVEEFEMPIIEELKISGDANALYVASPLLYETGINIKDAIKDELKRDIKIYGSVDIIGTGYSLARKRRKPIYQALVPGSIIFVKGEINSKEVYEKGLGVAKELGYGTVIPVLLR